MSHAPPDFAARPRRPAQLSTPSCSPAAEPRATEAEERLKQSVASPVKTLPFIFKPALDVPSLERLAGALV